MKKISFEIPSDFESVRLVAICTRAVSRLVFSDEDSNIIEICVVEALNNCIQHAYKGKLDQIIILELSLEPTDLVIHIHDTGDAMPVDLIEKTDVEINFNVHDIDNIPERGFGLKLLKTNMDEIDFKTDKSGNTLVLKKKIPDKL